MNVVVGTVTAELARATLAIGEERHSRQRGDQLVLLVDGVERRLAVATPVFLDKRELDDRWGDLASDPLAQLFLDIAPGDHVKCELSGWRLEPGTQIAIAELADQVMVLAIGSDEQARTRVAEAMTALRAESAPQEMKVIGKPPVEPRPPRPWRATIATLGILGLAGMIVSALTWIDPRTLLDKKHGVPFALALLVPSLCFLCLALLLVLTRPWFEAVDTQTTPGRFRAPWSRGSLVGGVIMGILAIDLSVGIGMMAIAPTIILPIRFFVLAALAVLVLVLAGRGQRPQRRLARLLRGSGVVRGSLVASEPPLVSTVRYDREAVSHGTKGDRVTVWYDGIRTVQVAKRFSIESDGRRMEVAGNRILWGAPLTYLQVTKDSDSKAVVRTHARIEPRASVLVRGKTVDVDGVPTFQATGAESFVIFGARGNARSALRRLLVRWYALAAILVAIAIGSIAFGAYLATLKPAPPVTAERPL